jgi:hypothetical protein
LGGPANVNNNLFRNLARKNLEKCSRVGAPSSRFSPEVLSRRKKAHFTRVLRSQPYRLFFASSWSNPVDLEDGGAMFLSLIYLQCVYDKLRSALFGVFVVANVITIRVIY